MIVSKVARLKILTPQSQYVHSTLKWFSTASSGPDCYYAS